MNTISTIQNYPASGKLSQAINTLKQAARDWDEAERSQGQVDRYLDSTEQNFRDAEYPARNASFDNAQRDSSWDGRELERHFRSGERNIDSSQFKLGDADRSLERTTNGIDSGQYTLEQLADEYRDAGDPRLDDIRSAQEALNSSEQSFGQVEWGWNSAGSSLRFTQSDVSQAQWDIREISSDRPGRDVSIYGSRVSSKINSIQGDLRMIETDMYRARSNGDSGEDLLDRAIAILEDAARNEP